MAKILSRVFAGPLFALVFALYPVLFIAVANPGQAAWSTVGAALAIAAGVSALFVVALRPVFKSWPRAGLAMAALAVLFYAYGPVHTALESVFLDSMNETQGIALYLQRVSPHLHAVLSAVWIVLVLAALRGVRRLSETWVPDVVRACNVTAMVLAGLLAVQSAGGRDAHAASRAAAGIDSGTGQRPVSVLGYNPDIYTIVLDGYAREDILRERYHFDNKEFLDGLRARGFHISGASTANYNWTFLSLASTLNMNYLQPLLGDRIAPAVTSRGAVYDAVRNNAVARFLRDRGYRIVHFQTTWGATLQNPYADEQIACHQGAFTVEFFRVLAEASWLKVVQSRMSADLARCHLSNLETLATMGPRPGPKFVFAHFLPPHHPYLFDRNGNILRSANLSNQFDFQNMLWEQKNLYLDQLVYMNGRITDVIDRILATSARPPIIIIQSDHGPNLDRDITRQEKIDIRLANLAAYRLPQAPAELMPADGSLVNQFRRILGFYFHERIDPLPDRHFFSPFDRPYDMADVAPSKDAAE